MRFGFVLLLALLFPGTAVVGFEKTDNTTTASVALRWRAAATMP